MSKVGSPRSKRPATGLVDCVIEAGVVLFSFQAASGRLSLKGDLGPFGLAGAPRSAKLSRVADRLRPEDAMRLTEALRLPQPPGAAISLRLTTRGGESGLWRGARLADGLSCAGVILRAPQIVDDRDLLTGLLTRPAFLAALAARLEEDTALTLVVGDLARVRRLNEALGYEVTDKVLTALGARLKVAFGPQSLAARVGDNTFAVVLGDEGRDPGEALRQTLETPMSVDELTIHPTLAVAAAAPAGAEDVRAEDLLRRAEAALGAVKVANRGRQSSHDHGDSLSHLTLEDDLRGAAARGEFEPFFQPIVRLADNQLSGFEALVRWRHPKRGLLPPDDFLPLVNETGLMADLSLLMARAAARQIRDWRALQLASDRLFISVNLTTGDLERPTLVKEVDEIIREAGLPHDALKLEITENEIMRDPDRAAVLLRELRSVGATLSLDDFGMGFSSLSWLARLPIDGLKIDRYFIRTMGANEGSAKIVRSVMALARDFDLEVVAEGVENAFMARSLKDIGCHYGQGFGYAPPMAAEEALVYLIEGGLDGVPI